MEITARYSFASKNRSITAILERYEILIEKDELISIAFIPEKSAVFDSIHKDLIKLGAGYSAITKFNKADMDNAEYLKISSNWYLGYPQPEDSYRKISYDEKSWCVDCFIGARQIAPFQIKTLPKWGKRSAFALNWVHDEIFIRASVYQEVFLPLGVNYLPVYDVNSNLVDDTVQLKIPVEAVVFESDHPAPFEICGGCGMKKYSPAMKGFYPKFKTESKFAIFKGNIWYGSGMDARRPIFVTKALFDTLQRKKIGGFVFTPVA